MYYNIICRGDLRVSCGISNNEESVSMFWYMECACQELSEVSFKLQNPKFKQQKGHHVHPKFCYMRMMWSEFFINMFKLNEIM